MTTLADPQEMLDKAVLGLFVAPKNVIRPSSFLASLYCSLTQIWDEEIPTACVNSDMELRINPHWFASLSEPMRETLLAHELWHVGFMHIDEARMGDRCPDKWNEACDHAINLMLEEHGFTFDKFPADHPMAGQEMGLKDPRFSGMSAEEIYEILVKEGGKPNLPFGRDFLIQQRGSVRHLDDRHDPGPACLPHRSRCARSDPGPDEQP